MRKTQYILPIVVGIMSGMILQTFGEQGVHAYYPLPPGAGLDHPEQLEAYIASLPTTAFLLLLANYAVCSLIAGLLATIISGRKTMTPALITASIMTLASIYTIVLWPHQPIWFTATWLATHITFAFIGFGIGRKKD